MHNEDDTLQYFGVDFNEEVMGLHRSDILPKAAFLADAINTVIDMYSKTSKKSKSFCYFSLKI